MIVLKNRLFHLFLYLVLVSSAFYFQPSNHSLLLVACVAGATTIWASIQSPVDMYNKERLFPATLTISGIMMVFVAICFWAKGMEMLPNMPYVIAASIGTFIPCWLRYRGFWSEREETPPLRRRRPY